VTTWEPAQEEISVSRMSYPYIDYTMLSINIIDHTAKGGRGAGGRQRRPCLPAKSKCPPRLFWRCSLTPAPTLGYMNVFSENYLGKTQFCIPPVLSDLISADVVV